jgi:hypothetical protein
MCFTLYIFQSFCAKSAIKQIRVSEFIKTAPPDGLHAAERHKIQESFKKYLDFGVQKVNVQELNTSAGESQDKIA